MPGVPKFTFQVSAVPSDPSTAGGISSAFQLDINSAPPTFGDYDADQASGDFPLCWESVKDFLAWKKGEEDETSIEFKVKETIRDKRLLLGFLEKKIYTCARMGSDSKYQKKHPEWDRKVPSKKIYCPCRVNVKSYPNTVKLLGSYVDKHSHEIGRANVIFTRLSRETRERIAVMLRMGISNKRIVSSFSFSILNLLLNYIRLKISVVFKALTISKTNPHAETNSSPPLMSDAFRYEGLTNHSGIL